MSAGGSVSFLFRWAAAVLVLRSVVGRFPGFGAAAPALADGVSATAHTGLSRMPDGAQVLAEAAGWIGQRLAGKVPTSTCGRGARGNPVEPIVATW